jgi:hypothetical protein
MGVLGLGSVQGQALNYATTGAVNTTSTFTDLGASGSAIATANTDDANSGAENIGFTFNFNGASFTQFVLNTNGFIRLGASAPSSAALHYNADAVIGGDPVTSTNPADVNLLIPFNMDLVSGSAGGTEYRVATTGAPGSRVCTIQWKNVGDKVFTAPRQYDNLTFQLKIYETTNVVEFVYNTPSVTANAATFKVSLVGIKGSGNASGQTVLGNKTSSAAAWSTTVFITGNYGASAHNIRRTPAPDAGRTYRFTPLADCSGTPAAGTAAAAPSTGCGSVATTLSLTGATTGAGGLAYQWQQSSTGGAGTYTNIVGANNATLAIAALKSTTFFQAIVTCTPSGLSATSNPVTVTVTAPATYAALPYVQSFEGPWINRCGTREAPDASWTGSPVTGNTSWRRDDDGAAAAWQFLADDTNPAVHVYDTRFSQGAHSARFHTWGATANTAGALDLLVNLSAAGNKELSFDYINPTGSDVLSVFLSNDGGVTFSLLTTLTTSGTFGGQTIALNSSSPTAVIRFRALSDFGDDDMGMDNLRVQAVACPAVTALAIAPGSVTTTGAQVTFTPATGATDYTVTYTPQGGSPVTVNPNPTGSPVNLTGLTPATPYTVSVVSNCGGGSSSNASSTSFQTLVPNDECATATTLTPGAPGAACSTVNATTNGATASAGAGTTCGGTADDDVWFKFVATATQHTITVAGGFTFDPVIELRTGACPGVNLDCEDNTLAGDSEIMVATGLTIGTTYNLRVYHYDPGTGGNGNFTICITSPPTCGSVTALAASAVTTTSANLTFTAGTGATAYTVTYTPQGGSATTVNPNPTASPVALTGLTPYTLYSASVTPICNVGTAPAATTGFVTTPYCTSNIHSVACSAADQINAVSIASTTFNNVNLSCANTGQLGYSFFAPAAGTTATLAQSGSYPVSVTSTTSSIISVWIDFDQDGLFEASEHTQIATASTAGVAATASISIPAGAVLGQTGMRVRTRLVTNANGPTDACTSFGSGETEDYLVTIGAPAPCSPVSSLAATGVTGTSANLTFTAPAGATDYTVTYTPQGGSATTVNPNPTASPVALTGLTAGTTYTVDVVTNCGGGTTSMAASTSFSTIPGNDQCAANSPLITCGSSVTGTTVGSTSTGDPTGSVSGISIDATSGGVFYRFVGNGQSVTLDMCSGTSYDSKLFVFTGSCGSLSGVVGSDDDCGLTAQSRVTFVSTNGTTYYVFVSGFQGSRGAFTLTATCTAIPDLVVTGNQTEQGTYNNVTIQSGGTLNLGGDMTVVGTLTVQSGGTLASDCATTLLGPGNFVLAAGATLNICDPIGLVAAGNPASFLQTTGTRSFSTDATYVYNGTTAQVTGPALPGTVRNLTLNNAAGVSQTAPVALHQVLNLAQGAFNPNSQAVTLLSDASGTALVVNGAGSMSGPLTAQRHIDGPYFGVGYRHYSSPVLSTTVADLATPGFAPEVSQGAAYNSSALPGTVLPFPNVFDYDETRVPTSPATGFSPFDRGWRAPTSLASPLVSGRGYTVNINGNQTVDFVGQPTTGVRAIPLSFTPSANPGWNLIGNPYPAPLDYSTVTVPAGMDAAIYVYASNSQYQGNFRSTVNGVGIGSILPMAQGFFVHATAPTTLNLSNANRVTSFATATSPFQRSNSTRPELRLTVSPATGSNLDDAYVYFESGATASVDRLFDAVKLANPSGLNLAALAANEELAINGLPLLAGNRDVMVPLTLRVPQTGSFTFEAATLVNFGSSTVYLRDAQTGVQQQLTAGTRYAFSVPSATAPITRFSLVFRPAGITANQALLDASQVHVYPNPAHGRFTLLLPPLASQKFISATLLNTLGQTVSTRSIALSAAGATAEFDTHHLAAGVYVLRLEANNQTLIQRVVVE